MCSSYFSAAGVNVDPSNGEFTQKDSKVGPIQFDFGICL